MATHLPSRPNATPARQNADRSPSRRSEPQSTRMLSHKTETPCQPVGMAFPFAGFGLGQESTRGRAHLAA